MSKISIPTTMRNCATCRRWTGTTIPGSDPPPALKRDILYMIN